MAKTQYLEYQFVSTLENTRPFFNALKAINFHDDIHFAFSVNGLKTTVEVSKNVQASIFVGRNTFSEFEIRSKRNSNEVPEITTTINLKVLIDCLSIFHGIDCTMKILYAGDDGSPLVLIFEHHGDNNLITECLIKTKTSFETINFIENVDDTRNNTVILRGSDFSNLLNDINKSAEELEISLGPDEPHMILKTLGVVQTETQLEVAKSSDMIYSFCCKTKTISRYRISHLQLAMKAIALAGKVSLRIGDNNLLALQMIVLNDDTSKLHIQFFILSLK